LKWTKESAGTKKEFGVKDIEKSKSKLDLSQVVDLYDEDGIMEEIDADNLVIEYDEKEEKKEGKKKGGKASSK
jgi:hypothetical protein